MTQASIQFRPKFGDNLSLAVGVLLGDGVSLLGASLVSNYAELTPDLVLQVLEIVGGRSVRILSSESTRDFQLRFQGTSMPFSIHTTDIGTNCISIEADRAIEILDGAAGNIR
ncbi:hypothetical protein [Bradyrhizobium sp. USDA 3364]